MESPTPVSSLHRPINWDKLQPVQLQQFVNEINVCVDSIIVPNNPDISYIDSLYTVIVNSVNHATNRCLPKAKFRKYVKPYWDEPLKDLHSRMKQKRNTWLEQGRPRGNTYTCYTE